MVETTSENGEPKKGDRVVHVVSGSWLGCVKFGNDIHWDWTDEKSGLMKKYTPIPHSDPLPSDSRYRADLISLGKGDTNGSQDWKVKLEVKQRKEERGRKEFAKTRSQNNPSSQNSTQTKKGWW